MKTTHQNLYLKQCLRESYSFKHIYYEGKKNLKSVTKPHVKKLKKGKFNPKETEKVS